MTDDELKAVIRDMKPRTPWGVVAAVVAVAGGVWGATQFLGNKVTREEMEKSNNRLWELKVQQTETKGDVSQVKTEVSDIKATVNEIRVNVQQLKDRKRQ